jgi:hypothetical protein
MRIRLVEMEIGRSMGCLLDGRCLLIVYGLDLDGSIVVKREGERETYRSQAKGYGYHYLAARVVVARLRKCRLDYLPRRRSVTSGAGCRSRGWSAILL